MNNKLIIKNKFIKITIIVAVIALLMEIFVFNFSHWYSQNLDTVILAQNVSTDENGVFLTDIATVDMDVRNVEVKASVNGFELAYVSVILTDEGDKYEYVTPEYNVCNGVERSGFSNIYPFDDVHTVQVRVRTEQGCQANIESVKVNAHIPISFKALRALIVFAVLWTGYFVWSNSKLHTIYFDETKVWQTGVTIIVAISLIAIGMNLARTDKLLMGSPWPHHKQYQELARSLDKGTVELTEQYVDPALLEAENPYDTIALLAEGVVYSMDYAFYNGKYYEYFGIAPELVFYYPFYKLTGSDIQNYQVMMLLYAILVVGVFITIAGLVRKYAKSVPYVMYLLLCLTTVLSANFTYLVSRCDIYNVPILMAWACTMLGLGCWLEALNTKKVWLKRVSLGVGAFSMAMVAGCRPQLLLISGIAIIWFFFEDGWKNRKLATKDTLVETVIFCVPYIIVAIVVGWYNLARFGNIFDFGATYSLTTNDMNHRGFNMNRLLRSLYCFLFQPPAITNDYPFLQASNVGNAYMGRFLSEYVYGGILVANTMMVSLWIGIVACFKKIKTNVKVTVGFFALIGLIIASFDANSAGVLFRYTCDFAPAFIIAALMIWLTFLDKSQNVINYSIGVRVAYSCMIIALAYAFLTFIASGGSICLANDNKQLFYTLAEYFKF